MPAAKKSIPKKNEKNKPSAAAQLDIIFAGPLLFVPAVNSGNIESVDVYAPHNGHPIGGIFVPGVYFSDDELEQPDGGKWPEATDFTLLDPHSYSVHLKQTGTTSSFPVASIPETNHKVKPGRKLSSDWSIAITVFGQLSAWTSHRLMTVEAGMFAGSDAPTVKQVAGLHKLSYPSVAGAEFYGMETEPKEYLNANITKGGTIIVIGEIPYQSSMLHERMAIDSLAKLAGLNMRLTSNTPLSNRSRLMHHILNCGISTIIA